MASNPVTRMKWSPFWTAPVGARSEEALVGGALVSVLAVGSTVCALWVGLEDVVGGQVVGTPVVDGLIVTVGENVGAVVVCVGNGEVGSVVVSVGDAGVVVAAVGDVVVAVGDVGSTCVVSTRTQGSARICTALTAVPVALLPTTMVHRAAVPHARAIQDRGRHMSRSFPQAGHEETAGSLTAPC